MLFSLIWPSLLISSSLVGKAPPQRRIKWNPSVILLRVCDLEFILFFYALLLRAPSSLPASQPASQARQQIPFSLWAIGCCMHISCQGSAGAVCPDLSSWISEKFGYKTRNAGDLSFAVSLMRASETWDLNIIIIMELEEINQNYGVRIHGTSSLSQSYRIISARAGRRKIGCLCTRRLHGNTAILISFYPISVRIGRIRTISGVRFILSYFV